MASGALKNKPKISLEEITLANDSDLTMKQLSVKFNCSTATLERAFRFYGIKKKPPHKGLLSRLNAETSKWLKENYININDTIIANKYGISEHTALKWRVKLGLRYKHEGKWTRYEHPRGFKGHRRTEEERQILSESTKKSWSNPNHFFNSEEHRQNMSDRSSINAIKRDPKTMYSRGSAGYRDDLGEIYFRSKWEANYARYLNLLKERGEIFQWEYEPDTFWFEQIKRGVRSYKPDFKVWDKEGSDPYYIEIKGYMDQKSKTKISRMAKYYPNVKLILVDAKSYYSLRSIAHIIPKWESCCKIKL